MSTPGPPSERADGATSQNRTLVQALRRRPQLRAGLVQLTYVAVGAAVGVAAPQIRLGPTVGADQLLALFAGIGGGLIAVISVVYALLFLVVQFGTTTHSPRLTLFRDSPLVWHAFGVFLGVFAYITTAVLVTEPGGTVSVLVPILGLVAVLACLAIARRLQLSALDSVQLAPILHDLSSRGREVLDRLYPEPFTDTTAVSWSAPDSGHGVIWRGPPAVLRQIVPPLLAFAERLDAEVWLTVGVGDMLWQDEVIIRVSVAPRPDDEVELLTGIEAGIERSFGHDPLLAFRLLNDIGLRATSPARVDPYTAIQVIDAIEGLLRLLTGRRLDVSVVPGGDGRSRVRLSLPDWEQFLQAAVDELLFAGSGIPSVRRRLLILLDNLLALSPAPRLPALACRRAQLADSEGR